MTSAIMSVIIFVDLSVSSASFLISSATTAKPLPDSPALAASILAFNESMVVCFDILLIILMIFDISSEVFDRFLIETSAFSVAVMFSDIFSF